jgi:hypothetical protein
MREQHFSWEDDTIGERLGSGGKARRVERIAQLEVTDLVCPSPKRKVTFGW